MTELTDENIEAMAIACGLYGVRKAVVSCVRELLASKPAVAMDDVALIERLQLLASGDGVLIKSEFAFATISRAIQRLAAAPAAPAQSEPIYQVFMRGLKVYVDTTKEAYDNNLRTCPEDVRIVYAAPPAQTAVTGIPEEVRDALTHEAGGWRGAACGTRDDAEGERRSADYKRRAQVIEDWLAAQPAPGAKS